MTAIELRTSIVADLEQMNSEMLENVSRYVKRLRHRARSPKAETDSVSRKREAAMLYVKTLSVRGEQRVPSDEKGIDALLEEK